MSAANFLKHACVALLLGLTLAASQLSTSHTVKASVSKQQAAPQPRAVGTPAKTVSETGLPKVLSNEDAARYKRIFALQEQGRWKEADRLIVKLEDERLLGHVQAQRYLHPTAYRSRYKELRDWLSSYADHPQAERIYKLAVKRRPKNYKWPRRPVSAKGAAYRAHGRFYRYRSSKKLSKEDARKARRLKRQFRRNILNTRLSITEDELKKASTRHLLDPIEINETYARLAAAWYYYGKDEKAYELAKKATRSRKYVPLADWTAGLTAWRLGKMERARDHFTHLAQASRASSWNRAAGAYWAARAHLRLRQPKEVSKWLYKAAEYPRTFYGLLARRALGLELAFDYSPLPLDSETLALLESFGEGKRALALIQLGMTDTAEEELSRLIGTLNGQEVVAFLSLTERAGMPGLAFRLGARLAAEENEERQPPARNRGVIDAALYPIPTWEPSNGYTLDRALLFAFMRQESTFNPRAKSPDGARGLLQLMPSTAGFIAKDRSFRGRERKALYDPSLNLELGQKYISYLLNHSYVQGDLFKLATAYNGGPGNLGKWERKIDYKGDPLLFIESLPSFETRLFIERVLTNLWIYRARLGQPAPSLDTLAAGDWPRYQSTENSLNSSAPDIAHHVEDR